MTGENEHRHIWLDERSRNMSRQEQQINLYMILQTTKWITLDDSFYLHMGLFII